MMRGDLIWSASEPHEHGGAGATAVHKRLH